MSKAERTREFIIEKASPIFNKKGYSGTSMADLIKATGLTKGAIYGNFENKDEVATAVFDYNISVVNKKLADYIIGKKSAADKLIGITEYYRINWKKVSERGGCPLQNASIEADDNLPFLKARVQSKVTRWVKSIAGIIEEGKTKGEFKKNIESKSYGYTIISVLEGGIMLAKIMNEPELLYSALDRIVSIINIEIKK